VKRTRNVSQSGSTSSVDGDGIA